ncbi:MAG: Lsm family RNA-binding protein [Thaumarchaeota archaeon]|nr:Lsm family RNA-binding protein [Nitrososphaerota archaeon]
MSSIMFRKFGEELIGMVGKKIIALTSDGKVYQGVLLGIDEKLNVIIDNPTGGENAYKVILNGAYLKEIKLVEKLFDLKALSDRLSRVFPGLVRLRDDIGAIVVMDKIKVTEQGVAEGVGLAADRVKAVYDEFVKETKK